MSGIRRLRGCGECSPIFWGEVLSFVMAMGDLFCMVFGGEESKRLRDRLGFTATAILGWMLRLPLGLARGRVGFWVGAWLWARILFGSSRVSVQGCGVRNISAKRALVAVWIWPVNLNRLGCANKSSFGFRIVAPILINIVYLSFEILAGRPARLRVR